MKIRLHLFILILTGLVFCVPSYSQNNKIGPLQISSNDTSKINSLIRKGDAYAINGSMDQALAAAKEAQAYSKKIAYKRGLALSFNLRGRVLYRKGDYDSSIVALKSAFALSKELNDSALLSSTYLNLGNAQAYQGNNAPAIEFFYKGLAIEEKLKVQPNLQWFFNNMGTVFTNQKEYNKALQYISKAKAEAEKNNNTKTVGMILSNRGWIYFLLEKNDSALYSLEEASRISEKSGDMYTLILSLGNLAELYIRLKQYEKAYQYSYRSYKLSAAQNYKDQMASSLITFGSINIELGKYNEAEHYLITGLNLSQQIETKSITKDASLLLAKLYEKKGDLKKAYEYYKLFSITKDTLLNQENSKIITEMNTKYTTEKKEKEIELLKKNEDIQNLELARKKNELERQRTVSISVFIGFLMLMVVAILTFSRYRLKKKANDQLQNAFNLIEEKNTVIEKSNVMITDSIMYAKRIQDAILPAEEELIKILHNDFFIFYQPAQIVSGDFYWCSQQQNKIIFVVADCTGHGVPGAFMSMIGNTLLNEIVNERKVTATQKIAELLDEKIIHSLHQHTGTDKYDGMDISICCIDKLTKEISFTGAHHAMYAYNGHLEKVKGDPYSIGGAQQQKAKLFSSKTLRYEEGLCLYFLTDGYCDQSGGEANKRFSTKHFERLLEQMQHLSMADQKEKLELAMETWKGTTKQRDDMLVVGIRF